MRFWSWLLRTTLVGVVPQSQLDAPAKPNLFPKIQLNDNHQPAGHLAGGVLKLSLVSDTGCDVEPRARLRAPLRSPRSAFHQGQELCVPCPLSTRDRQQALIKHPPSYYKRT